VKLLYSSEILSKKIVFFTGKGGVGKSALASATALMCKRLGKQVFLVTWNPFDVRARALPYETLGIRHFVLEGLLCFKEYALTILKFETLVDAIFQNKIVNAFIQVAPGLSEAVIAGKIWDLSSNNPEAIVLVDLPATGHALSFFSSPIGLRKLFKLGLVHREIERICEMFFSESTQIQLVTLPEELPITETLEFQNKLSSLGSFHFLPILLNQCLPALKGHPPKEADAHHFLSGQSLELFNQYFVLKQQEQESLLRLSQDQPAHRSVSRVRGPEWITTVEAISKELEHL